MRIGSLFSGIGGLELGLEWAELGTTQWQAEIDPLCRETLERHWPLVERFGDVRAIDTATLADVDLICGGFPCQDVSAGGKKAGLAGAHSGLWDEFRRIVAVKQPRWCVVENVTSGAKLWVDVVRSELEQLGYASLPINLEARWFGAPHVRSRIFIIADRDGLTLRQLQQRGSERWARELREEREPEPGLARWWSAQPRMGYVGDGLSTKLGVNERRALGNAVMPQMAQVIGEVIKELQGAA